MNFECGTQCQIPPQYRCNGFNNNYAYPMQNSSSPPPTSTGGFSMQTSPSPPSSAPQMQNNQQLNQQNIQFVLCLDQTVFLPDRFEVYIDARGFSPTDIKINITRERVEVLADKSLPPMNSMNQCSQKRLILSRIYTLPQPVVPEMGMCSFKDDCLTIAAPWARQ